MLPISLLLISVIVIILLTIVRRKNLNKLFKQILIGCLSLILFVTSPLVLLPLNHHNAAFAAGNDPCATPGKDGPSTSAAIINTYFAAAAGSTLNAGVANTSITLGTQSGAATPVATGDMLMLIQMQDADINSTNFDTYGDGASGGGDEAPYSPYTNASTPPPSTGASGFSALNNTGRYEYVTATNVSGGGGAGSTVTIKGTGLNKGLNYTYRSSAATGTAGQRSYQIIRVPQYSTLTLNAGTTALPWDGTVGGVFAVDVAGTLTFGGGKVLDLWGKGFRGGAGRQIAGGSGSGANTDYRTSTATLTGKNGSKGEGVAGTPKYVISYFNPTTLSATTFNPPTAPTIITNTNEGYPNGSYARGAPGNAGGGSTDGNSSNSNDQNSGGGGGSNGGDGGRGGRAWSSQLATGGYGGKAFTTTDFDSGRRLFLGGGGGAGTTNDGSRSDSRTKTSGNYGSPGSNSTVNISSGIYSSGGTGGGIAAIRANSLAGSGTLDLRGVVGLSVGQDGAGGGGAGGTAYISANTSSATITIDASGGNGGWATFGAAHGPGGGGGGGAVYRKSPITSTITASLAGGLGGETGVSGNTSPPNFFAAGGTGVAGAFDALDSPGISSGDKCIPQLTVTKTTSTPTLSKPATGAMTATYTITVANASLKSPANNVVISDLLPTGFTYESTTSITLSAVGTPAATRPTTTNPTVGSTNPSWGTFTIPESESVTIVFNVNIPNNQALGTYQNPATATYDDPVRTTSGGTTTATYNPASSTGEDVTLVGADYGDAPDTYGTDSTAGNSTNGVDPVGASHTILSTNNPFIGTNAPDADGTNAPTPYNGTGDDVTNTDDEDGVTFPVALTSATSSYTANLTATNNSGTTANIIGWIDFNYDGQFQSTEAATTTVVTGSNNVTRTLTWSGITIPPFTATSQQTYARFRITTDPAITTSTPAGSAANGEVEDYAISIQGIDYGDAPDTGAGTGVGNYQTTSADGGASHTILSTLKLGTNVPDADSGTLQNAAANADDNNGSDDEDGVTTFPTLTTSSSSYSVTVNVLNNTGSAAPLVGWIDFNRNGVFEATEGQGASVPSSASPQNITLNWTGITVPTSGNTYARFRISDAAVTTSTPNGAIGNGEVEDYLIPINVAPSLNIVKRITNVNGTDINGFNAAAPVGLSNDGDLKWPIANTQYLRGAVNSSISAKPGDLVEYTIYFLSNGSENLKNAQICDAIPANTTFEPNTYGAGSGILLGWDSTGVVLPDPANSTLVPSVKVALTNANDGDLGKFLAANTAEPLAPSPCNLATNNQGAILVKFGAIPTIPFATSSGTPKSSYGFVRFKVKVD